MARLKWFIIPVFLILLMSHNSSALSAVYDFSDYDLVYYGNYKQDCITNNSSQDLSDVWACDLDQNYNLRVIQTHNTFNLKKGDIVEFNVVAYSNTAFSFINSDSAVVNEYTWPSIAISRSILDNSYYHSFDVNTSLIPDGYKVYKIYHYTFTIGSDNSAARIGVGKTNQNNFSYTLMDSSLTGYYITYAMRDVQILRKKDIPSENEEQEQKTQEQSEAGDDASSSSTDDVGQATQSLASAMGSIVSVIKDTPASDCNINISTTGSSSGFTSAIGALNLCSGVPSNILNTVRGLAALVIVPYVLYAAYSICIKMYRTFTEVQNT